MQRIDIKKVNIAVISLGRSSPSSKKIWGKKRKSIDNPGPTMRAAYQYSCSMVRLDVGQKKAHPEFTLKILMEPQRSRVKFYSSNLAIPNAILGPEDRQQETLYVVSSQDFIQNLVDTGIESQEIEVVGRSPAATQKMSLPVAFDRKTVIFFPRDRRLAQEFMGACLKRRDLMASKDVRYSNKSVF